MDANGLFLIVKDGALVLNNNKSDYINVGKHLFRWLNNKNEEVESWVPKEGIKRVAITWDGFSIKNYYNQRVFYADADTGNLNVKGTIFANELKIGGNDEESSLSLNEYLENPDALICNGLTLENIKKIWPKEGDKDFDSITVYYDTEEEMINYLCKDGTHKRPKADDESNEAKAIRKRYKLGKRGDIWYNIRAPKKELTIFSIFPVTGIENKVIKTIKTTVT